MRECVCVCVCVRWKGDRRHRKPHHTSAALLKSSGLGVEKDGPRGAGQRPFIAGAPPNCKRVFLRASAGKRGGWGSRCPRSQNLVGSTNKERRTTQPTLHLTFSQRRDGDRSDGMTSIRQPSMCTTVRRPPSSDVDNVNTLAWSTAYSQGDRRSSGTYATGGGKRRVSFLFDRVHNSDRRPPPPHTHTRVGCLPRRGHTE